MSPPPLTRTAIPMNGGGGGESLFSIAAVSQSTEEVTPF
jgi:hypothetical protein